MTDDFLPPDTSNTPSFAAIPSYTGKEQDTDTDNNLEIYLNVSELLYHKSNLMKDLLSKYDHFSGQKTRLFTRLTCNKRQEQEISGNTSCRNKCCRI